LEVGGRLDPRVTAAFWDENGYLTAPDPWETVLEHGASVVEDECIEDFDLALERARTSYDMSDKQIRFVRSLFERKIAHPPARIKLSESDISWLRSQSDDPQAFDLCVRLFEEMNIAAHP